MTSYRYPLLLVALLCSAPALAQRGTTAGAGGVAISNRVIISNRATTTDWRQMTSGIRAGEALWRNFWRNDRAGPVERNQFGRNLRASAAGRDAFRRELRGGALNILTGTSQRIDILSGRPID